MTNGFAGRSAPRQLPHDYFRLAATESQPVVGVDGHLCISSAASICRINDAGDGAHVLLVGDSHAADYSNTFRRYVSKRKVNGWELIEPGCGFMSTQRAWLAGQCGNARELLSKSVDERTFDTVIVVADYYGYFATGDEESARTNGAALLDLRPNCADREARYCCSFLVIALPWTQCARRSLECSTG